MLTGIDMFTREMVATPLKTKGVGQVNEAFKDNVRELVGNETNFVVTTDQGPEFARLDDVPPEGAVHREKPLRIRMPLQS